MKKIFLSLLSLVATGTFAQQSFSGLRTSVFGGTFTTISNPANVLGARPWDANLFSVDASLGNNSMGFSVDVQKSIDDFTKNITQANIINAGLKADILGPSFLFRIDKENAVGLTSRGRILLNTDGIDAKLLQALISSGDLNLPTNPLDYYNVGGINDMNVLVNAFYEIGATYARTLYNDGYHLLRAGATVKLVQGSGSFRVGFEGINENNVKLLQNANGDPILRVGNGYAEVRTGGLDILHNPTIGDAFSGKATTVGFDLGFVYEYSQDGCPNCDGHIPYDLKVGLSLLDLGRLSYKTNRDSFTYTLINQDINLNKPGDSFDNITSGLKRSQEGEAFHSSLPTTLNLNVDYRFVEGVYLNLTSQFNMVKKNAYNARYTNDFVLTPRWENNTFGAYLPLSINGESGFGAGAAFRVGPFTFGSRSILSNLVAHNSAKELNFFFGIRFGGAYQ